MPRLVLYYYTEAATSGDKCASNQLLVTRAAWGGAPGEGRLVNRDEMDPQPPVSDWVGARRLLNDTGQAGYVGPYEDLSHALSACEGGLIPGYEQA